MKIDLRKTTKNLLDEIVERCDGETFRLEKIKDISQFEKGQYYAFKEISVALKRTMLNK